MDLQKLVIPGEDPAQLDQLAASLTDSWDPADFKEQIFVNQLIHHNWQLERLRAVESQTWTKAASADPANFSVAYEKAEKLVAGLHRLVAGIERSISRATTDLRRLQEARVRQASRPVPPESPKQTQVRQASRPVASPSPKQTQFENEVASWPDPDEQEQSQFEYPPVPKGADERQFPTDHMRRLADWRSQIKKH